MTTRRTDDDESSLRFSDLIDVTAFSRLLGSFHRATGIPSGLVAPNGELITQTGWLDACALFHRVHPEAKRRCLESNLELMRSAREGEVVSSVCQNGLIDYATPLVIEGRQLATLFVGQVLDERPDLAQFRRQARRYGFDEEGYIEAIRAVPIVGKAQMEANMGCMVAVVQMLARSGLARFRETKLARDLHESTERRIQMEDLLELSPVGISWCNADGELEYVNRQFTELFGRTLGDLPDLETWYKEAYPDSRYRKTFVEPWARKMQEARRLGVAPPALESTITCGDGRERRVLTRVSWVGEKLLANYTDITAQWRGQQRNRAHGAMLERVAKAERLPDILHAIVRAVEAEDPTSLCCVLLVDDARKRLLASAAPGLPAFFVESIDGMKIGLGNGSCGTAAYLRERVVTEEISTHEYWQGAAEAAARAGLAACWSEPIFASDGEVLGTFDTYRAIAAVPGAEDVDRITFAANLAAVAIESQKTRDALLRRERIFRTLAENAPINISRYDKQGRLTYANPRLAAILARLISEPRRTGVSDWPDDPFANTLDEAVAYTLASGEESSFEAALPTPGGGRRTHLINMVAERDQSGAVVGALATGQDIEERKRLERELKHQARLDFLTGLANRRHFIELAEKELARVRRYGGELSLVMLDIDVFKRINDAHGHNAGDLVLQTVAQVGLDTMRETDIVGRLGGEEFVILLPAASIKQAADAAERLRLAISEAEVKLEDGTLLRFTASFGVSTLAAGEEVGIDELLSRADSAMYDAKHSGRNCVSVSDEP